MKKKDLEQTFLTLVEANKKIIYKVSLMYADNGEHQKDIYQDIVLNLWQAFPHFRGDSKESSWIYRIALNTCVSDLRKKKRNPQASSMSLDLVHLIDEDQAYREQVQQLYQLINRLSQLERAIILLWLDEKSYDEISAILGISKVNVGVKITRIKEKLKKMNES